MTQPGASRSRDPLVRAVEEAVRRRLPPLRGETVVVAVSGGADSVCLALSLSALARPLDLRLRVAHLDHGWRGDAAAADAAFVERLAARLGWPYSGAQADAPALARAERLSPEEAARRVRYSFLRDVCRAAGARYVATGHNLDDQVESALIAFLRGSGPAGLAAMSWVAPLPAPDAEGITLLRPLLALRRDEIRSALSAWGEPWREDATNLSPKLLRNRVRHELVPLLESLAPGFREAMVRSAELMRQAYGYYRRVAQAVMDETFVTEEGRMVATRKAFLQTDPALQSEILRQVVGRVQGDLRDVEWAPIEAALEIIERGRGGATAWLSPRVQLRLAGGRIIIEPRHCAGVAATSPALSHANEDSRGG